MIRSLLPVASQWLELEIWSWNKNDFSGDSHRLQYDHDGQSFEGKALKVRAKWILRKTHGGYKRGCGFGIQRKDQKRAKRHREKFIENIVPQDHGLVAARIKRDWLWTEKKKYLPKIAFISSSQWSHIMQEKKVIVRIKLWENSWITRHFWGGGSKA